MGELFALACALFWSFAVILFRKSGDSIPPLALNLFRVGLTSVLFLLTMWVQGIPLLGQAPARDYWVLMASGVIAIAISDTLFHMSLNRVGAGINAIVDSMYSPSVVFFAYLLLGETISFWQFVGMVIMILSIIIATQVKAPKGTSHRTLVYGVILGVGAMCFLGFGIVLAKGVLEEANVLWATTIRQLGSLAVLVPAALIHPDRRRLWRVFVPNRSWRYSVPGTLLGSYFALIFWIAGMKYISAGRCAILNQTSTIYLLILASWLLKEPFGYRRATAALLAIGGALLVISL
ncbi:MAG: EamA family transporter [Planctomycetota bacterium]|nr:MAG: EamA family transporter [Planctomycetota bacterium]